MGGHGAVRQGAVRGGAQEREQHQVVVCEHSTAARTSTWLRTDWDDTSVLCVPPSVGQIYGEILFFPFAEAVRWVAPSLPEHAIFYDLVRC